MSNDLLPDEWAILRAWLPKDLDEPARRHGFFQRARGLQDAECWLRLILLHVAGGLSLEQTAVRARELGLAQITAVALFKRLRRARGWLLALTQHLLKEQQRFLQATPLQGAARRLRVIDATDVQEPGSTGTALRLHYSLQLPEMNCDHFELTDRHGGERLGRFDFAPGEWVLADRGYCHRAGAAEVLQAGTELILRWQARAFPLEDASGKPFLPMAQLRRMPVGAIRQWPAYFVHAGRRHALWLCVLRKSRLAAERSRRRALRKAQCNGTRELDPKSLELTEYFMVLTSLPPEQCAPKEVFELYRCRWQIELAFKRLKSLLAAGHVPKKDDASAKSWMQAKILTALLVERVLWEAKLFSPWGYRLHREPVAQLP